MKIQVSRKKNASGDRLINIFNKEFRRTQVIKKALKYRFRKKKNNKRKQRESAIVREKYRAENRKKRFY